MSRYVFDGDISGVGTQSGTRLVVGHWTASPLGEFTDVMVEFADGERLLLAPSPEVRDFVTATYTFDRHEIVDVVHRRVDARVSVEAGDLRLGFTVGSVTLLGRLLAVMPDAVVTAPWFCTLSDPIARVLLSGVRTRGTAGGGRREFYGARGQHRIVSASASWRGDDLGGLTRVEPPVRFGFGSTPAAPSSTAVRTTVEVR